MTKIRLVSSGGGWPTEAALRGWPTGAALRALAVLGLVGPPALQQGGQFLPEEDEEVM